MTAIIATAALFAAAALMWALCAAGSDGNFDEESEE